jgi:regulator of RNase E activity RraA
MGARNTARLERRILPRQYGDSGPANVRLKSAGGPAAFEFLEWRNDGERLCIHLMPTEAQLLTPSEFERLRRLDCCTVSNAIERFEVRLRNEGFVRGTARCQFPTLGPMLGYAATAVIRASNAPMGGRCYYDRMDYWRYLASIPEPRVMVLQDIDPIPGIGAFVGEIHASIALALNCAACVTNGAVRDLPAVEALGFHLFAGSTAVSHAYAHIVEFGEAVEIGGLKIRPGELVHGDRHGVHTIPRSIAAKVPEMSEQILAMEKELIQLCRSAEFSLPRLAEKIETMTRAPEMQMRRTRPI